MVHIPNEKRKKLDKKSKKCVFVGYADNAKAYRLFDTTKKIIMSRDVAFFETDENKNKVNEPTTSRLLLDDECVEGNI